MRNPATRIAFQILLIAFGAAQLAFMVWVTHKAPRPFYDFDLHYFAAAMERTGSYTNLSGMQELARQLGVVEPDEGVYGTPILVALIYLPMTVLSLWDAHTFWNVVMVAAPIIAMRKAVGSNRWVLWLLLLTFSHSMLCVFSLGNVSVLSFALAAYAFGAFRQGQGTRAAVCLGISAALKAYPAFLLLVLVAHRRWRELGIALGVIAAMGVATIFALGFDDVAPAVKATMSVGGYVHPFEDNASLPGLVVALTDSPNIATATNYLLLVVGAAFILRYRASQPHITLAMTALTMLMVQSIAWRHYFPLTIIALLALRDLKPTRMEWYRASIAFVFSNGFLTLAMAERLGGHKASSVLAASTLLLLFTLTTISRREQKRSVDEVKADDENERVENESEAQPEVSTSSPAGGHA